MKEAGSMLEVEGCTFNLKLTQTRILLKEL